MLLRANFTRRTPLLQFLERVPALMFRVKRYCFFSDVIIKRDAIWCFASAEFENKQTSETRSLTIKKYNMYNWYIKFGIYVCHLWRAR